MHYSSNASKVHGIRCTYASANDQWARSARSLVSLSKTKPCQFSSGQVIYVVLCAHQRFQLSAFRGWKLTVAPKHVYSSTVLNKHRILVYHFLHAWRLWCRTSAHCCLSCCCCCEYWYFQYYCYVQVHLPTLKTFLKMFHLTTSLFLLKILTFSTVCDVAFTSA